MNFDKAEMLADLKKLTKLYQDTVISFATCNKKTVLRIFFLEKLIWGNSHITVYSKEKKMHSVLNMK